MKADDLPWIERIYNKIVAPRTIKFCGYSALITFFGVLGLAIIVAIVFGPGNYNIIDNWISDMGSFNHTPAPFLLDASLISTGILLIPFHFYIEKHLAPIPGTAEDLPAPNRWAYRLMGPNFFFNLVGSFSMVCVGIISEDRDIIVGGESLHFIFSVALFGAFAFGAIFLGFRLAFMKQPIVPKPFNFIAGIYGIVVPFSVGAFAAVYFNPLWEWIIFFVLLGLITPIFFFALRHAVRELKEE